MDLTILIEPKLDLTRLATILDELGHEGRLWSMQRLTPSMQARLFEAAQGFRPIGLDHFVPDGVPPMTEVPHQGHNSLPAFTSFAKVFCKPAVAHAQPVLYGYNRQAMAMVTGPGYYVAYTAPDREGEVAIDYRRAPTAKPEGWPALADNSGRGAAVYGGMVDYVRGVSKHVSVGRAWKNDAWMDAWFVLVRGPHGDPAG